MKKQDLLRKYLNDECSQLELQKLYTYLKEDNEEEYQEILYEVWSKLDKSCFVDDQTTEKMFNQIQSDLGIHHEKEAKTTVPIHRAIRRYSNVGVAAAVAVIFIASGLLFRFFFYNPLITAGTNYGKTRTVELPDGSSVYLYANSEVRYSDDWSSSDHREVWLKGEAFFMVEKKYIASDHKRHDSQSVDLTKSAPIHKKFTVHTSNLDVEVIGTTFNVRDRRGETQVVLNSGQIKLKTFDSNLDNREEYLMKPGDLAFVDSNQQLEITKVEEPDLYSLWKRNELYFDNRSLKEIALELNDSHGVQVRFEEQEISELRFTGSTPVDNLQILFTTIQKSFDLEIIQDENEIMIKHKK